MIKYMQIIISNINNINMRQSIIIFLMTIFTISCVNTKYKLEYKKGNNNSFENAQYINKNGVIGQLEIDNMDYYYFINDKTQIIDFYISNSTYLPVTMTLYDYQTNIIKVISETEILKEIKKEDTNEYKNREIYTNVNDNEKMEHSIQIMKGIYLEYSEKYEKNKYYISIVKKEIAKENIDYILILKNRDYKETDEIEPNDKISHAQIIDINSDNRLHTIEGYYSQIYNPTLKTGDLKNMEVDAYKITNSSFNTYSISIEVSGVPAIDTSIRLYYQDGNWITIKDINNSGDGEIVDKLILYPYNSYYFILQATNAVNNIAYRLNVIAKPYDKYTEYEPNNKKEEAQVIEYNNTYKGAIDYSYDRDYYIFNIPIKSSVKLSYYLIDSQAINISISNELLGRIAIMPQSEDSQIISLVQGRYYLIFERDLTKEGWKKGISKPRNYEFNMSISNEISGNYNYYDDYTNYSDYFTPNKFSNKEEFEESLENNFNNTIIIRPDDYNSDYYYYSSEDDTDQNDNSEESDIYIDNNIYYN